MTLLTILLVDNYRSQDINAARPPMYAHGRLDMSRCSYCHSMTYGVRGTSNLAAERSELCLLCHSSKERIEVIDNPVIKKGRMKRLLAKTDIYTEFDKPFFHPVLKTSQLHREGEDLPEKESSTPRHVACTDCHDHHQITRRNRFGPLKITGALKESKRLKDARDMIPEEVVPDFEICFNCHSDSENLPLDQSNKRIEFNRDNPSYHPVVSEGKNTVVPSLKPPYAAVKRRPADISVIKCGDCHGNNDEDGPSGVHGSRYPFILRMNYSLNDEQPESSFIYALCYKCHERDSILRDDSFRFHSLHIRGNTATGSSGTSCFTCHDAHGSTENRYLIKFNEEVVFPNISTGQLRFIPKGTFSGECYLTCHDVSHSPKGY